MRLEMRMEMQMSNKKESLPNGFDEMWDKENFHNTKATLASQRHGTGPKNGAYKDGWDDCYQYLREWVKSGKLALTPTPSAESLPKVSERELIETVKDFLKLNDFIAENPTNVGEEWELAVDRMREALDQFIGSQGSPSRPEDESKESLPKAPTIDELVGKMIKDRAQIIERFVEAYIAETGLNPSEIEMVEQHTGAALKIWFQRKSGTFTPDSERSAETQRLIDAVYDGGFLAGARFQLNRIEELEKQCLENADRAYAFFKDLDKARDRIKELEENLSFEFEVKRDALKTVQDYGRCLVIEQNRIKELEAERDEARMKANELGDMVVQMKRQIGQLEAKLANRHIIGKAYEVSAESINRLAGELDDAKARIKELEAELDVMDQNLAKKSNEIGELETQIRELEAKEALNELNDGGEG